MATTSEPTATLPPRIAGTTTSGSCFGVSVAMSIFGYAAAIVPDVLVPSANRIEMSPPPETTWWAVSTVPVSVTITPDPSEPFEVVISTTDGTTWRYRSVTGSGVAVAARVGVGVADARLAEVAEHYQHFGGVSPINAQCRALIEALRVDFVGAGITLPIYWGNRNWHPYLEHTVRQLRDDGIRREHQRVRLLRRHGFCFLACEPKRMLARKLAARDALIDVGGKDRVGLNADAGKEVETARARRGEDQPHQG